MTFCANDGINTPEVFQRLNPRHTLCGPAYPEPAPLSWPNVFRTLPPGTRVRVTQPMPGFYEAGAECVILTHSEDGCTLLAFDAPLKSWATKTKPADAWWADTTTLEVL